METDVKKNENLSVMTEQIRVVPYTGKKIHEFIPDIAKLRMEVFREYPFLYEGNYEYEMKYLRKYADTKDSLVVVAFDGKEIIGISTALPFSSVEDELKKPFVDAHLNTDEYFYFGESVLRKKYRGLGIGHRFFDEREKHTNNLKTFKHICFCTVRRSPDDPRRPSDFRPLNSFWQKRGYKEHPELVCTIAWKEIGETLETPKELVFWTKKI